MTLAELKRRLAVGTYVRKVTGYPLVGRVDQLRIVVLNNSQEVAFDGEGVTEDKGPSYLSWPKAKEIIETDRGFKIHRISQSVADLRWHLTFEWIGEPTPKDRAVTFLLNSLENCSDHDEAVLTLGDSLGNHDAAKAVMDAWNWLDIAVKIHLQTPAVCDRRIRHWLDGQWDWTNVPQTIDA